jgi:hypothetical protein
MRSFGLFLRYLPRGWLRKGPTAAVKPSSFARVTARQVGAPGKTQKQDEPAFAEAMAGRQEQTFDGCRSLKPLPPAVSAFNFPHLPSILSKNKARVRHTMIQ